MNIKSSLKDIVKQIESQEKIYQRKTGSVMLLAVSKTRTVREIEAAIEAGQQQFGENYAQEGVEKIVAINNPALQWHFIGPIQSNKCRLIAEHYAWVHSVDRLKIAQRLSDARPTELPPLNICLQVNISKELSKSGVGIDAVADLAKQVQSLPQLQLRGLMAIPAAETDTRRQRQVFKQLHDVLDSLNQQGLQLDTLSMGMSNDYEAAIAEGATIVRIGSAIFGTRNQ